MPKARIIAATLALAALCASFTAPSRAQSRPGLKRLYILNCGEGVAGDISRWSPGVNEGTPMDFVDNCYLIKHAQGWMLWDTGVADAIAAMPDGQKPADPRATHWRRPKTLAGQMEQLGIKPSDIKYLAVSHTHPDHIGNVEMFPQALLLVQKAEYEWPAPTMRRASSLSIRSPSSRATRTCLATAVSRSSRRPVIRPAINRCW